MLLKIYKYFSKKLYIKLSLILIILFLINLNFSKIPYTTTSKRYIKPIEDVKIITESIANVVLFDLNQALEPIELYNTIQCRKSAFFHVSTTLCVHDIAKDVHVSGSIWQTGVWEENILRQFTDYLKQNPDCLVLDVGAQIGQYSLFAAQMGHDVLTVEPFYDNIIRLHKAAKQENIQNKIKLVKNAISNKRNEIKMLSQTNNNIGAQSLLNHKDKIFSKNETNLESNKYLVETILFDDIVAYLPKKQDGSEYKKCILKIDIEGFEPYAFQNAGKLFDKLDIRIIFMEWGNIPEQRDNEKLIVEMIDFLLNRNFVPYDNLIVLQKTFWKNWPWDIIWHKK